MASRLHFLLICVAFTVLAADASPSCEDWQVRGVVYYNTQNFSSGSPIESNIITATDLAIAAARNAVPSSAGVKVGTGSAGEGDDEVFAYGECYGLSDPNDCGNCLVQARNRIKNVAPSSVGGRLCTAQCSIRFEIYEFYSAAELGGVSESA